MTKHEIPELYRKAFIENETDANKKMTIINAIAAGVALILEVFYVNKFFTVGNEIYVTICILFPAAALILLTPLTFLKTELIKRPRYKNFLIFSFIFVVAAVNITIPKHGVLGWALAIVMANHYYNPRFAYKVFITTVIAMLGCMYLGMLFGEYDPLLMGLGVVDASGNPSTVDGLQNRIDYINRLMAEGNNRYVKALFMYYLPRVATISLLFVISNTLNRRTNKLLFEEVKVHGEQEKVRTELNVAKDIQINTLPTESINDGNIEVVGGLTAAKEVGGDLYDYLYIDDDHVAMLIGDVSGKGVPAAMFMMKTIQSFRDFATVGKSPSQILKQMNVSIKKGNKAGMFVTCFLAIIDKRNGKVVYSNAGHNPPIIGSCHNFSFLKPDHGLLLGTFDDPPLKDEEFTLQPGESITLYTDGVTEARNNKGGFYGEDRLLESANKDGNDTINALHSTLQKDIGEFVKGAPQSDDITIVTLKYLGDEHPCVSKTFKGYKKNIEDMLGFVGEFYDRNKLPKVFRNKLLIVGDEVLSNIVKHGYGNNGGPITIEMSYTKKTKVLLFTITDQSTQFNQLEVNRTTNEPSVGGYGIYIVKNIMDDCVYEYKDGCNVMTLKKRF